MKNWRLLRNIVWRAYPQLVYLLGVTELRGWFGTNRHLRSLLVWCWRQEVCSSMKKQTLRWIIPHQRSWQITPLGQHRKLKHLYIAGIRSTLKRQRNKKEALKTINWYLSNYNAILPRFWLIFTCDNCTLLSTDVHDDLRRSQMSFCLPSLTQFPRRNLSLYRILSKEKATASTEPEWPLGCCSGATVAASRRHTVLSDGWMRPTCCLWRRRLRQ